MYYSTIGVLAVFALLILNGNILLRRNRASLTPAWSVYRRFLFAVLAYYVTDILWGILDDRKLDQLLFADTTIYFVSMAVGVLFWAQYTVAYLEEDNAFGRVLIYTGRVIAGAITIITVVNIFVPILFTVSSDCVYHALPLRYVMLACQVLFLLLISAYAFSSILRRKPKKRQRYRTLALFGIIMATFLFVQLWFPYLPLYTIAYMLGTGLLHSFVVNDEKEEYRRRLEEAYEKERSAGTVFAHIAMSLARDYMDLYYVNTDTDEYIQYGADADSGALTELLRGKDFFGRCRQEADRYVYAEDRAAFVRAMERRALTEALDRRGVFELIFRKLKDGAPIYVRMRISRMKDDERVIVIGVTDVDEQMKRRRAEAQIKEEHIVYDRLHALTGNFLCVYVVEPETNRYREFSSTAGYEANFAQAKDGMDFFTAVREAARVYSHPEDPNRFLAAFTKENVMAEIQRAGIFTLSYRLMMDGSPLHVQLKAAMVEEKEGRRLIVGVNDIHAQVQQEEEYGKRLAQARSQANLDPLTGIKNKHAYMEVEERLNRRIGDGTKLQFSLVILDVNDLKKVNDTAGHQAGDQFIRDACKVICDIFTHSAVFRVGGDEFAVISQGKDYACMEELLARMSERNARASKTGEVMIACGMARYENDACVAAVFKRTDQAMYENKSKLKAQK